jgi:sugar-specific transcriptional regulator TrmB
MRIQKVIEQLGYKPNEAKAYLTALSMGQCTITDLAEKLNLPRTSVQVFVNKLHADGVMNFYKSKRRTYWSAEKPDIFFKILKEKEIALETIFSKLDKLKPAESEVKPSIKVFCGIEEIKLIYDDMLTTKHDISAIIPWERWNSLLGNQFIKDFVELRVNHFLKIRILTHKTPETVALKERDSKEMRMTNFMPNHIDIRDTILIYENKIAIISLNKKFPTGVVIGDTTTGYTMRAIFEDMWDKYSHAF